MKRFLLVCTTLLFSIIAVAPDLMYQDRIIIIFRNYERMMREEKLDKFITDLGKRESGNNWKIVNSINCLGEFQFAYSTLKYLGYEYITPDKFRTDPSIFPIELQRKVLKELINVNEIELARFDCNRYIGTIIGKVPITKAGLLAGSHLGGVGSVINFLTSNGAIDKQDVYGTRVSDYIRLFSLYDL